MKEIEKAIIRLKLASNSQIFKKYNGLTEDITLAISALEKQIPKKPIPHKEKFEYQYDACPCCEKPIRRDYGYPSHCTKCGQEIDWSVEE